MLPVLEDELLRAAPSRSPAACRPRSGPCRSIGWIALPTSCAAQKPRTVVSNVSRSTSTSAIVAGPAVDRVGVAVVGRVVPGEVRAAARTRARAVTVPCSAMRRRGRLVEGAPVLLAVRPRSARRARAPRPRRSSRRPSRCATRRSAPSRGRAPWTASRTRRGPSRPRAPRPRSGGRPSRCPARCRSSRCGSGTRARPVRDRRGGRPRRWPFSVRSPEPVKPAPCMKTLAPIPRALRAAAAPGGGRRNMPDAPRRRRGGAPLLVPPARLPRILDAALRRRPTPSGTGPSASCPRRGGGSSRAARAGRAAARARCGPCAARSPRSSAARRSRGTRRSAACSSRRRCASIATCSHR